MAEKGGKELGRKIKEDREKKNELTNKEKKKKKKKTQKTSMNVFNTTIWWVGKKQVVRQIPELKVVR